MRVTGPGAREGLRSGGERDVVGLLPAGDGGRPPQTRHEQGEGSRSATDCKGRRGERVTHLTFTPEYGSGNEYQGTHSVCVRAPWFADRAAHQFPGRT